GGCITPYSRPLASSLELLDRSHAAALETGDLPFACYANLHRAELLFMSGTPLSETSGEVERCVDFARRARFDLVVHSGVALQRLIEALRGRTARLESFDDARFSEEA